MKCNIKAALNRTRVVVFITLWPLCGCADITALNWLTGEPLPEVISAPRVVKIPQHNDDRKWPNLADIPKDKPAFSTMAERKVDNDHLVSDKFKADAQIARIQNIYVPLPPGQQQEIDNANTNNTKLKVNQDDMPQRIYKPFSALRP